ncbi:MAG: hypothetical protein JWO04_1479 [Gammaproteobacteria bacterium]|nr:hypothetical protein [Gammaproteobacteria bacterium]
MAGTLLYLAGCNGKISTTVSNAISPPDFKVSAVSDPLEGNYIKAVKDYTVNGVPVEIVLKCDQNEIRSCKHKALSNKNKSAMGCTTDTRITIENARFIHTIPIPEISYRAIMGYRRPDYITYQVVEEPTQDISRNMTSEFVTIGHTLYENATEVPLPIWRTSNWPQVDTRMYRFQLQRLQEPLDIVFDYRDQGLKKFIAACEDESGLPPWRDPPKPKPKKRPTCEEDDNYC